jgi:hypothetical protein
VRRHADHFRIALALDHLGERDLARQQLAIVLAAFVEVDAAYLRSHSSSPSLRTVYDRPPPPERSGSSREGLGRLGMLEYQDEPQGYRPPGEEDFQDIPTCLRPRRDGTRAASNRDLVAWRVAELRVRERVPAEIIVERRVPDRIGSDIPLFWYRTKVALPDGHEEDLSPGYGWRPVMSRNRFVFVLDLFDGPRDRKLSEEVLGILLRALTEIDAIFLRAHPETPRIYRSGVVYREEPSGMEDWQDIPTCLRLGKADCDDVSPWRAAEIQVRERTPAEPYFASAKRKGGGMLYHILVNAKGRPPEDPSYVLGMR